MPTLLGSALACLLMWFFFKVLNNNPSNRNTTAELALGLVSALIVLDFIMLDPSIVYSLPALAMASFLLLYTIAILVLDRVAARYIINRT
jgi:hypothetical protein